MEENEKAARETDTTLSKKFSDECRYKKTMLKNKDRNRWKEGNITWNESMCSTNQVCTPSGPQLTPAQDKFKSTNHRDLC